MSSSRTPRRPWSALSKCCDHAPSAGWSVCREVGAVLAGHLDAAETSGGLTLVPTTTTSDLRGMPVGVAL
jgi:hypothetical protein